MNRQRLRKLKKSVKLLKDYLVLTKEVSLAMFSFTA